MQITMISGQDLKFLLKKRGISQQQIVADLQVPQPSLSRYLNDVVKMPAELLVKIAVLGGLSINDLIDDPGLSRGHLKISKSPEDKLAEPTNHVLKVIA